MEAAASTESDIKLRLRSCHAELLDMMDSRFELPAEMFAANILSRREYSELQDIKAIYRRNEFILRLLDQKPGDVLNKFVKCLRVKHIRQGHVAYCIEQSSSVAEDLSCRPLTEQHTLQAASQFTIPYVMY